LDERGREIEERVALLAVRGLARQTTKQLFEKPHDDLQIGEFVPADGTTTSRCLP
jgi:hypothetical protein